jgi:hypothetical protein
MHFAAACRAGYCSGSPLLSPSKLKKLGVTGPGPIGEGSTVDGAGLAFLASAAFFLGFARARFFVAAAARFTFLVFFALVLDFFRLLFPLLAMIVLPMVGASMSRWRAVMSPP